MKFSARIAEDQNTAPVVLVPEFNSVDGKEKVPLCSDPENESHVSTSSRDDRQTDSSVEPELRSELDMSLW